MNDFHSNLVVLVADKNMESSILGLLARPEAIGIKNITSKIYVHAERDPGCLRRGHDFLRPMFRQYEHAMIMFDRHGCGKETETRESLENIVDENLSKSGWGNRASTIVIDPELENWVWSDSPEVDRCLGWKSRHPDLRTWLNDQGLWPNDKKKPPDPKKSAEKALREVGKPRSSSIYKQLGQSVSINRCTDPAFVKLRETLLKWFKS